MDRQKIIALPSNENLSKNVSSKKKSVAFLNNGAIQNTNLNNNNSSRVDISKAIYANKVILQTKDITTDILRDPELSAANSLDVKTCLFKASSLVNRSNLKRKKAPPPPTQTSWRKLKGVLKGKRNTASPPVGPLHTFHYAIGPFIPFIML